MRTFFVALAAAGLLVLSLASSSCSSSTSSPSSGAADAGPPTFSNVYTTVIAKRCAPCHTTSTGDGVKFGQLDMTSQATAFQNLVNVKAAGDQCGSKGGTRVVPNQPDSSVMYLKISLDDPSPCGEKMPLGGPALSQVEADLVEAWINAGAKND